MEILYKTNIISHDVLRYMVTPYLLPKDKFDGVIKEIDEYIKESEGDDDNEFIEDFRDRILNRYINNLWIRKKIRAEQGIIGDIFEKLPIEIDRFANSRYTINPKTNKVMKEMRLRYNLVLDNNNILTKEFYLDEGGCIFERDELIYVTLKPCFGVMVRNIVKEFVIGFKTYKDERYI